MKERSIFHSVIERRTQDMAHLSRADFGRRWGRYNVVYQDSAPLASSLAGRLVQRSPQETTRVVRSQQKLEKALGVR